MSLSDKAIEELRAIYRDEFHQEITTDQAQEIGARLMNLVRLLLRPLPGDQEHHASSSEL